MQCSPVAAWCRSELVASFAGRCCERGLLFIDGGVDCVHRLLLESSVRLPVVPDIREATLVTAVLAEDLDGNLAVLELFERHHHLCASDGPSRRADVRDLAVRLHD